MNLTAITIVGLVAWMIVSIVKTINDKSSKKVSDKQKVRLENEIAELRERVETLEKIVTDSSFNLRKEIDALDKDEAA